MAEAEPQLVESENEEELSLDSFGLDPLYTPDEIQRIQVDADNQPEGSGEIIAAPQAVAAPQPQVAAAPQSQAIAAPQAAAAPQPQAAAAPQAAAQAKPPQKKKRKREKQGSDVWEHFKMGEEQEDGTYTATCIYCAKVFLMGNQRSTSSMWWHFRRSCKKVPSDKRRKPSCFQKLLQTANTSGEPSPTVWEFDQLKCRKSFAKMVIVHEYPFNCTTHWFLRAFLKDLQPKFKMISRTTLRAECIKIFQEERDSLYVLLGKLDCKVSFTSDLWTNKKGTRGFMTLTCHYIDDDWHVRKRILNFTSLPSPHTGKHIAEAIFQRLVLWNLDKKVFCLTLDNASSNDVCVRELMDTSLKNMLPVDGQIFHQRCGCHILNLIVQDGLAVLDDQIVKVRETMKYLRHSQARAERLERVVSQVNISMKQPILDVPTRWNSTYLMLDVALHLRPAIVRYAAVDRKLKYCPNSSEWAAVTALVGHLKVFYDATLKLSGSKYPTLNLFFPEFCEIYLCIKSMRTSEHPFVVQMGQEMMPKWEKYWSIGNTLLAIACVLDPRCKLTVIEYYLGLIYTNPDDCRMLVSNVQNCLAKLLDEYKVTQPQSSQTQAGSSSTVQSMPTSSSSSALPNVTDTRALLDRILQGKNSTEPELTDLEKYLQDPLEKIGLNAEFDILSWWKINSPKYPVLGRLARDVLAVPISTVASEAAFSTSGRTLSSVRSCLNNESVEALICAQDWLRAVVIEKGQDIGESMWNIDENEMETEP